MRRWRWRPGCLGGAGGGSARAEGRGPALRALTAAAQAAPASDVQPSVNFLRPAALPGSPGVCAPQHLSAVHTWHTGDVLPDPLSPHPCLGPQATMAPCASSARGGPGRMWVRPSAPAQHTAGSPVWRCAPGTRAGDGDGSAKAS